MKARRLIAFALIGLFLIFWAYLVFANPLDKIVDQEKSNAWSTTLKADSAAQVRLKYTAVFFAALIPLIVGIAILARDPGLYNRGVAAYVVAALLLIFYLSLYYTRIFDVVVKLYWPGGDRWFFYGGLYTVAVVWGGLTFVGRNRRSRYQTVRTISVMTVQVLLAFSVPILMRIFLNWEYYFSYLWPLKIDYFYPYVFKMHPAVVIYSFLGSLVMVPLLGFFFGKRWYCSWVCGCGGLANTFGDPWRHLSSKTRWTWKFETVSIHSILIFALFTTSFVFIGSQLGGSHPAISKTANGARWAYGLFVATILSGMAGVFLYPILGTRFWCRFFCPMAALLGLIQKFGRYRITINGKLCMACGNCSKYCEMGIDVRAYAMRGEHFRRASCVGCGICAHVCPRGVLRLENGKTSEEKLL